VHVCVCARMRVCNRSDWWMWWSLRVLRVYVYAGVLEGVCVRAYAYMYV